MAPIPEDEWSQRSRLLAALLARVGLGDRAAFAEVYRLSAAHLLGVVLRIQPVRAQAEEVLQEIYLQVWRAAAGYQAAQGQPLTWLTSIARHRAIDSVRRQRARPQTVAPALADDEQDQDVSEKYPDPGPGPAELWQRAMAARLLQQCLGGLSSEQQQSLALAYYQGLSHSEVAEQLKAPLGSVKSWVRRGLQALRACLERAGGEQAL
ncbi:sigma-70 family RNA polymerase sigma factor [Aquabacterium sp. A7-Y]|uniref:sigma-70 family RNA polymerase sigma factor n=1 Tax=Aquabacterium sp. A7-Y TaxID=1349605 RepID=UPI00223C9643|nr:sigma-70 family RNA polymerase sigma factor [Aquabacterium sp. A7-Y]MCW7539425.1 sigma-70 family RNA polymerase sigma factor [Aquabacterium sp. A7-Y]